MVRVNALHQLHQLGIEVFIIGNQCLVDFLICTCLNLPAHKRIGRRDNVVTGFSGQHLAFQRFIAVVHIISNLNAVFLFKIGNGFRIDVFRPVVNFQYVLVFRRCRFFGRRFVRTAARCKQQSSQDGQGQMFGHYHSLHIRLKKAAIINAMASDGIQNPATPFRKPPIP